MLRQHLLLKNKIYLNKIQYMKKLSEFVNEKLGKWDPPDGLFVKTNPREIAQILLDASDSEGQAMKRLVFYMNRAGEDCPNKTVLNKVKDILRSNTK